MLVVHGNWTSGALHLWAESLEACARSGASAGDGAAAAASRSRASGAGDGTETDAAVLVASEPARPLHPYATTAAELAAVLESVGGDLVEVSRVNGTTVPLRLPALDGLPLPSDRLMGSIGSVERSGTPMLDAFDVPCVTLDNEHTISALLRLEDGGPSATLEFGHSLRFWMAICRLTLELLEDQRFIPTLIQNRDGALTAAWQPWLHDESARVRVGALLATMPPVARAVVDDHAGQPWPIVDEALRRLTDATVRRSLIEDDFVDAVEDRETDDPHVAWLTGLLAVERQVPPAEVGTTEMLRDVGAWIALLDDTGQDQGLRLCFRLDEPDETVLPADLQAPGDDVRWRLSFHVRAGDDDETLIDAARVWQDPAAVRTATGGRARNPEELLLAELGRAERIYPKLETALTEAAPIGIDLLTSEVPAFLNEFRGLLEESGFVVIAPEWWGRPAARLGARLQVEAPPLAPNAESAGSSAAGHSLLGLNSIVRYRWQVAVGDQVLSPDEFRALAQQKSSLIRVHGRWVEIPPERIADASSFLDEQPGGEMPLLEAIQLAHGAGGARLGMPVFGMDASGWVADLLGASAGDGAMPVLRQSERFVGTLRPYQEIGLSWLSFLDRFGLGACLADDMGLGKTIQLIALLLAERDVPGANVGPTLLVVPTSVVSNWKRELGRFAPELRVHVQHGPDRPVGDRLVEITDQFDVVITTYTLVSRDRETLMRTQWHRVVLDEAQYIKNPPTKQTATIRSLRTLRRIALTGTPVENRLSELWSIMEFCNPGYLGQPGEFRRRFSVPIERHRDQERAEQLRNIVRPFVLRRLKTDPSVIDDLPPCVVTREFATLTSEQAAMYERAVGEMLGQVGQAEGIQRRGLVLATLVKLKQICNHPALIQKNGSRSRSRTGLEGAGEISLLSRRSGKSRRLMEMMEEVVATGDKALVFTQFRRMGHLLSSMFRHDLDAEVMFLHGGTPPQKRQEMIDRFQDPAGGIPIFVLSLKAGGIGVNLTAANHVFHFDRWWNPAVENQATDRAFRIGQSRTVHVHKFVCLGTLEERIDQMIEQKTELARNIIGSGEEWLADLSTGRLRELLTLRHSAMDTEV
ncbi:MAG: DEAD/DEAH box helicase [Planctomycetes bacterium]|nr:DEAD/DEAH box helicase [Planctomycetota bacterium]